MTSREPKGNVVSSNSDNSIGITPANDFTKVANVNNVEFQSDLALPLSLTSSSARLSKPKVIKKHAIHLIHFCLKSGISENNNIIHFDKDQIPQVKGFWSITMYNSKGYFADNPINRYAIGDRTQGLKYNEDGSIDIYIQHENPGKDKENDWLPAPIGEFSLAMRLYIPDEKILKGEYQIPPVQMAS